MQNRNGQTRPRQYAAAILSKPVTERAAALAEVPERIRPWVKHYLDDAAAKQAARSTTRVPEHVR